MRCHSSYTAIPLFCPLLCISTFILKIVFFTTNSRYTRGTQRAQNKECMRLSEILGHALQAMSKSEYLISHQLLILDKVTWKRNLLIGKIFFKSKRKTHTFAITRCTTNNFSNAKFFLN